MIKLYETKYGVRDDDRPKHTAENAVNHEADTAYQVYNPYLSNVFQDKAQHDEKRRGIADDGGNFWVHYRKFLKKQTY